MLYGIVGGLMGTAWTQVIKPYMIFSSIGLWIRNMSDSVRYGEPRYINDGMTRSVLYRNTSEYKWDHKLPFFRKFIKGIGCIYCVSTWFTILTYIIFIPVSLDVKYHFIGLVTAIGMNMVIATIIATLRELDVVLTKNHSK
jgi:hypothetical protein